ncbi:MAG: InlB B-repeat-containing protein, partial [Chitinophagales bacterium]|nr:InlB B-repeat-containing protein [Chitinophagales bacterium]
MTKSGNTFAGWDSDNDGTANFTGSGSETFTISANTTLYAQWTPSGCTTQTINPIASSVTKTYGDVAYSVATTATSSLTVTYSSSNTSVATVDASGNVTIVGAGTATITAAQAGNSSYCAATSLTQALTVNKKNLTITGLTANDKLY